MMTLSVVTHSQWAQPTMLRRLKIAILIAGLQSADVVLLLYRAGRLIVMFFQVLKTRIWGFHRPAWAVGSYSSGPPAGGTPQILVFKTLRMTSRPAL